MNLLCRIVVGLALTLYFLAGSNTVGAQESERPDAFQFFRKSQYGEMKLSPSGRFLGAVVPLNGRRNLAVIDLLNHSAIAVTAFKESDIRNFQWVNDDRLVYTLIDLQSGLGEQFGSGLFAVNRDSSQARELASQTFGTTDSNVSLVGRTMSLFGVIRGDEKTDDVLVVSNARSANESDVYRLNTKTGRKLLLTERRPGKAVHWVADGGAVIRAAVVTNESGSRSTFMYRANDSAPWEALESWDTFGRASVVPIAFDATGNLFVEARGQSDRTQIWSYDLEHHKLGTLLYADDANDVDGGGLSVGGSPLIFDQASKKLIGVTIEGEKRKYVWLDKTWAKWAASLDAALPDHVNLMLPAEKRGVILVLSYSDRDPGRLYVFEPERNRLEEIGSLRPWIKSEQMAARKFIRYAARDGLSIPAYLTLPAGRPAAGLPLVVLVHGGPYVRGETWGFDPEAEFLASRGYAVLQPDYRGSLGYGYSHYALGLKQWGQTMQDDLNDGALALVERGIVDKNRMCLMGASYGGYAVMMGLARDPDFWRCGINYVGVTDTFLFGDITWADYSHDVQAEFFLETHMGDPVKDRARYESTSPVMRASSIRKPVLMAYGGEDRRVPIEHGTRMKAALERNGTTLEWVVYPKEAHGWLADETNIDFYTKVEKFLAQHLQ
jgi:dipeptidyl aminopeptidase/acylaminoacyl peptidase